MPTPRRRLTPTEIADQLRGSTRIAPGIWRDRHGDIHFSVVELLALVDLPDTPENREQVFAMVRERLAQEGAVIIEQEQE